MNKIVIQYQTHQVLTNKNNLTEMNHQLWKKKCHITKQPTANTNTRTKGKSIKSKENYERGKDYLRNIEWRTVQMKMNKINLVLPYISMNNITKLHELVYAGVKLVCKKIGVPSKIKIRMENSPGNLDKKNLRKQAKMIKQTKETGICRDKKEKATQEKITIQLEEINQKVLVKEGRLKRY